MNDYICAGFAVTWRRAGVSFPVDAPKASDELRTIRQAILTTPKAEQHQLWEGVKALLEIQIAVLDVLAPLPTAKRDSLYRLVNDHRSFEERLALARVFVQWERAASAARRKQRRHREGRRMGWCR